MCQPRRYRSNSMIDCKTARPLQSPFTFGSRELRFFVSHEVVWGHVVCRRNRWKMAMHVPAAGFAAMLKEGAKVLLLIISLIVYIADGSTTTGWRRQYLETSRLAKNWPRLRVHRMDQMVSCTIANKRK